jgi:hypothetical protein
VAVAARARIEELVHARVADRGVGRERQIVATGDAGGDAEAALAQRGQRRRVDALDARGRGRLGAQGRLEADERVGLPLHLDEHATRLVAHEAVEAQTHRQTLHEGAKPHSLHDAPDGEASAGIARVSGRPHPLVPYGKHSQLVEAA